MKFLLSLILVFLVWTVAAQNQSEADSLKRIYEANIKDGEDKMELLRNLAYNETNDPNLALKFANELIELARSEGNLRYLYRGYLQKGNTHITLGNLADALQAYQNARDAAIADGYKIGEGTALMSFANTYVKSGDPDRAAEYFEKGIEIYKDSLVMAEPIGKAGLGTILYNAGEFYLKQGNLSRARTFLAEAGEIFSELGAINGQIYVLGNQGILYAKSGDFRRGETNMQAAIKALEESRDFIAISDFQTSLAEVYMEMEEYERAHTWAEQAVDHALRLGLKEQISTSSLVLAQLDSIIGNFDEAYSHLNLHMRYKDSMDVQTVDMTRLERERAELANAVLEMEQAQLESEMELQTLQQKRQRAALWATGVTALLLVVLFIGSYRRYRYTKKTNKIISEEKDRSDQLLLNILPQETALELKQSGRVRAQRFEAVTVLFTDFKGFTQHAEALDPEHLVESIDYYFSYFDTLMDKHGLEKIKTVGDAYMCASGLPNPMDNHAHKMIEAAFDMLDFVETNRDQHTDNQVRFEIRIGINSGPVVAGVVGTKKFAYDIWGDTVNIAARMESASEIGRINVASGTYHLIKDDYDCVHRGSIPAKNKGELDMYFVNGPRDGIRSGVAAGSKEVGQRKKTTAQLKNQPASHS